MVSPPEFFLLSEDGKEFCLSLFLTHSGRDMVPGPPYVGQGLGCGEVRQECVSDLPVWGGNLWPVLPSLPLLVPKGRSGPRSLLIL